MTTITKEQFIRMYGKEPTPREMKQLEKYDPSRRSFLGPTYRETQKLRKLYPGYEQPIKMAQKYRKKLKEVKGK